MRPRPTRRRPAITTHPHLEALEDRWLPSGTVTTFQTRGYVSGVTAGPDGHVWYASGNDYGYIDSNGNVINYSFPNEPWNGDIYERITTGPDGNLWSVVAGQGINLIRRITPQGQLTDFNPAQALDDPWLSIDGRTWAWAPDGTLWFHIAGSYNSIPYSWGRLSPDGAFTFFNLDAPQTYIEQLVLGPDGNLWTSFGGGPPHSVGLARINSDLSLTYFPTPYAPSGPWVRLTVGADGNFWYLYTDVQDTNYIGRLSLDGDVTEFALPGVRYPTNIAAGPDGNVWFSGAIDAQGDAALFQITEDGTVTAYPVDAPPGAQIATSITAGADNDLWFNDTVENDQYPPGAFVGRLTLPAPGPLDHFGVRASMDSSVAGQPFALTVRAQDANGTQVCGYKGTVHFSSADQAAGLPADYTFTAADCGVHTFAGVTLDTAGAESISVSDAASGVSGSVSLPVSPAAVSSLRVLAPASIVAGQSFSVTIRAQDAFGNVVPTYQGAVHFSSSDGGAALPVDYQFQASDQGVHTFAGVTLCGAGNQSVSAGDGTLSGLAPVSVSPAAAASLQLDGLPSSLVAGQVVSVALTAFDAFGNVATGYAGTVHFASSDAQAGLPADAALAGGVGSFSVTLKTAGSQSVTAADSADGLSASQTDIEVSPAATHGFRVFGFPSPVTAGVAGTVEVDAIDAFGNLTPSFSGAVKLTSSDPRAVLPDPQVLAGGAGSFSVTLFTAAVQSIGAADTDTGTLLGQQDGIEVDAAAAAVLAFDPPAGLTVGVATTVSAWALDRFGNLAAGYTGTVHFSSSDPRAILPADYTFTAADGGLHTFVNTLILRTQGAQSLGVGDSGGSLTAAQGEITVGPRTAPAVVAVAGGLGDVPEVRLIDPKSGQILLDFLAYDPRFRGGVRVAVGDINADGVPDVVTVPGITGGADLKVWDGKTGYLLREFAAFPMAFTGGAFVAVADVNNDGYADIVTGKGPGSGPRVKVFSGKDGALLENFLAYDPSFAGGVRVASGDVDADGYADVITGAGPGGGPHVEVWSGKDGSLLQSFFAFAPSFTGGVYVSAGDVDGDGHADIIAGSGAGGLPEVKVFSGLDRHLLADFLAYGSAFTGGVRVGAFDLDGDGKAELLTAPGQGPTHSVKVFAADQTLLDKFFAFDPTDQSGVMLGGG